MSICGIGIGQKYTQVNEQTFLKGAKSRQKIIISISFIYWWDYTIFDMFVVIHFPFVWNTSLSFVHFSFGWSAFLSLICSPSLHILDQDILPYPEAIKIFSNIFFRLMFLIVLVARTWWIWITESRARWLEQRKIEVGWGVLEKCLWINDQVASVELGLDCFGIKHGPELFMIDCRAVKSIWIGHFRRSKDQVGKPSRVWNCMAYSVNSS